MFNNTNDGPEEVTIPSSTYMSCYRCKHYEQSMAHSGGLMGSPSYYMDCTHPDAWGDTETGLTTRSLTTGFSLGGGSGDPRTPSWCPYLKQEKENG